MTSVAVQLDSTTAANPVLDGLLPLCAEALPAAERLLEVARTSVLAIVAPAGGKIDADLLEANQTAAHGYAWMATYVEGLRQILGWASRLEASGELTELENLILQAAFGE
jgi:(2S)-methylsuccinyl-CoA dehydrogenase